MRRLLPTALKLLLHSPLLPRIQRRIFFGAPLPPLDPAFGFRQSASEVSQDAGTNAVVPSSASGRETREAFTTGER